MLNDLLAIERGLSAHKIDVVSRHPDIKIVGKGWVMRARLRADGGVASVEIVPEDSRGVLWTLRNGNFNGFPGLKTKSGLLQLRNDVRNDHVLAWDRDKSPTARRVELLRLLDSNPIDLTQVKAWPTATHRKRIRQRLKALAALAENASTAAVPAAFQRFIVALNASPPFLQNLADALAIRVRTRGDEWVEPARAAMIGPIALSIDVAKDDFERDAGDLGQIGPVSAALSVTVRPTAEGTGSARCCALSGEAAELHSGNFPQPNLPGLGQTYIFSRNKDIPSLTRFGRTADASFPIGAELVSRLSGAITELTYEAAEGNTWRLIPAETGIKQNKREKPDLLVVSLPPPLQGGAADALVDDDDSETVRGETRLIELGRRVLEHSKGKDGHGFAADMAVLVVRGVDKGKHKAIFYRPLQAAELYAAATNWQAATVNTPSTIKYWIWVKADGVSRRVLSESLRVSPLSLTPVSKMQFLDGGRHRYLLRGATFADAFALFLQEGNIQIRASDILALLLRRHTPLLFSISQAARRGDDKRGNSYLDALDPKSDLRRDALSAVAWLGVLLHCLGRPKETYMVDIGFQLGQLLAAADVVHIGYCTDIRGGDVPSALIGNSVFSIAGSNPLRALALLQARWKPYAAWATFRPERQDKIDSIFRKSKPLRDTAESLRAKNRKEEALKVDRQAEAIEAPGWAIRNGLAQAQRIRVLTPKVASGLVNLEVKDVFRAELLLGYMAGLPPIPKEDDS